jgi:hypothetical protein
VTLESLLGSGAEVYSIDFGVEEKLTHFACNDKVIFNAFASPSPHTPSYGAPIYVANIDGTGLTALHRGALAPGPQRVVAKDRVVVFTSADPFTTHALPFPPANVYVMALDGGNVRQVTHFIVPGPGRRGRDHRGRRTISASGDTIAFEAFGGTGHDAHCHRPPAR